MVKKWITEVVMDFLQHKKSWSNSLTSDGTRLLSYGEEIGRWGKDATGKEVLILPIVVGQYSRTTTRHRRTLEVVATSRGVRVIQENGVAKR